MNTGSIQALHKNSRKCENITLPLFKLKAKEYGGFSVHRFASVYQLKKLSQWENYMPLLLICSQQKYNFSKVLFQNFFSKVLFLINGKLHTHQGDLEPKSSTSTSFLQPIGGSLLSWEIPLKYII